jgi:hypothetical protein
VVQKLEAPIQPPLFAHNCSQTVGAPEGHAAGAHSSRVLPSPQSQAKMCLDTSSAQVPPEQLPLQH